VQLDLRDRLVGERRRHHEARVARGAAEVHEAALGQDDDGVALAAGPWVVFLNFHSWTWGLISIFSTSPASAHGLEARHVDLVVEVADVADDGVVLHLLMWSAVMIALLPVAVTKMSVSRHDVLDRHHVEAGHARLQRADRVDLGDRHARVLAHERLDASPCPRRRSRARGTSCRTACTSVARMIASTSE
jgi:hypothetical protein